MESIITREWCSSNEILVCRRTWQLTSLFSTIDTTWPSNTFIRVSCLEEWRNASKLLFSFELQELGDFRFCSKELDLLPPSYCLVGTMIEMSLLGVVMMSVKQECICKWIVWSLIIDCMDWPSTLSNTSSHSKTFHHLGYDTSKSSSSRKSFIRDLPYLLITNWWRNREILNTSPFSACLDKSIACSVCPEDDSLSIFIASWRGPFQWIGVLKSAGWVSIIKSRGHKFLRRTVWEKNLLQDEIAPSIIGGRWRDGVDLINDMSSIWSLPLAPTHRDMCASNIGGRLCHSLQPRPLFCGDGVLPLTNEAMDWGAYCTHVAIVRVAWGGQFDATTRRKLSQHTGEDVSIDWPNNNSWEMCWRTLRDVTHGCKIEHKMNNKRMYHLLC
jgi:hypothetical protein